MAPIDVKICGLSDPRSVDTALAGGASHLGFIFFPKSPRNVTPEQAAGLVERVGGRAVTVAVTVDAADDVLDRVVSTVRPGMLQLHGSETAERMAELRRRYNLPLLKAVSVRDAGDLGRAQAFAAISDRILLDAKPPEGSELPGGNGLAFDWSLLQGLDLAVPYMLSGGLNCGNVTEALRITRAGGLDVSSGVESAPGVKDDRLIGAFLAKVRDFKESEAA